MFCSNCGQRLPDDARFCTGCGQKTSNGSTAQAQSAYTPQATQQPVYAAPVQPVYQQPVYSAGEQVVLVMSVHRKYSMFKLTACYIVFMNDKIVLAHLSTAMQKAENERLSQEIKASGTGFFKGSAAMMSYWANYQKKYYQMSSQQILAENPQENRLIPNQSVSKIFFSAYDQDLSTDGSQTTTGGKLNIDIAGGETLKFTHSIGSNRSTRDTLLQLFGGRLKYRR